jgi:heptosyltransferase-2
VRTLFIKLGAIGDVVQAAVAMQEFRRRNPAEEIHWVAGRVTGDLVKAFGVADRVTVIEDSALYSPSLPARVRGLIQGIRAIATRTRYDRVIVAYSDPRYQYLGLGVRARRRESYQRDAARMSPLQHRNRVHEYWRLLSGGDAEPIDIAAATQSLGSELIRAVPTGHVLPPHCVILAPGGAKNLARDDGLRRWPIDRFRALAQRLIAAGRAVVLVGASSDAWAGEALADLPVTSLIGRTSLLELASVLDASDVVVCNDSGILHLATLTRAGLVALFGPTPANAVVPLGRRRLVALQEDNRVSCSPCYDGKGFAPCAAPRCLEALSVERVLGAILSVSQAPAGHSVDSSSAQAQPAA